jgi:hypothetical protein
MYGFLIFSSLSTKCPAGIYMRGIIYLNFGFQTSGDFAIIILISYITTTMRAYLSGGMERAKDSGASWRSSLERWLLKNLSHQSFNPVRVSKELLAARYPGIDRRRMKENKPDEFRALVSQMIDIDLHAVAQECDYCICYWDRSAQEGAGTQGEITLARYLGKPVYLVTKIPVKRIPGWVIGCSTHIFAGIPQLKRFLRGRYGRESLE